MDCKTFLKILFNASSNIKFVYPRHILNLSQDISILQKFIAHEAAALNVLDESFTFEDELKWRENIFSGFKQTWGEQTNV